jgi:ribosomal protein L13E
MKVNKPIVKRHLRRVEFTRNGRGFSQFELKEVGLTNTSFARNNGIPVDILRKTNISENVEQLKLIAKEVIGLRKRSDNLYKEKKQQKTLPTQTQKRQQI